MTVSAAKAPAVESRRRRAMWIRLGFAAALLAGAALLVLVRKPEPAKTPSAAIPPASVVVILVDTLRADHLGTYGYSRATSPSIDRLASRGVVFLQARSVAPWTNPSIAALFTGRHPRANFEPLAHRMAVRKSLPADVPTLAEKLQRAGLRTAAFVDHPGIAAPLGFERGFDAFVPTFKGSGAMKYAGTPLESIVSSVRSRISLLAGNRFFLYIHLIYPHRPYQAPPPYDGLFGPTKRQGQRESRAKLVNSYDGEIRYTDDVVARILATLEDSRLLDSAWIILTGDHGEGFWEHGRGEHGNSFYDELLHVPLIVVPPRAAGLAPRRIPTPVSTIDLHRTVLALAGVRSGDAGKGAEGRSLLRFLEASAPSESDQAFSESPHSGDVRGAAILEGWWKLIRRDEPGMPPLQLYDLRSDPAERINRAEAEQGLVDRLDAGLQRHLAEDQALFEKARGSGKSIELDDETVARLRALGYLH